MRPCKPAFTSCVFMKFSLMYRLCYYTTDSLLFKQNFFKEIRTTFGAGGFVCSLSEKELSEFHQYLEKGFPFNDLTKVKKGISYAGLQPEDNVWVLNKHLQIDAQGRQIAPNSMKYAWQPLGGPCIERQQARAAQLLTYRVRSSSHCSLPNHFGICLKSCRRYSSIMLFQVSNTTTIHRSCICGYIGHIVPGTCTHQKGMMSNNHDVQLSVHVCFLKSHTHVLYIIMLLTIIIKSAY